MDPSLRSASGQTAALRAQDVTLLDLLDRVVDHGVILAGDVTISVAGVDLIYLGLRVLLAPVERLPELMSRTVDAVDAVDAMDEERSEVAHG